MEKILQWKIFFALVVAFATTQCAPLKETTTPTKEATPPLATRFIGTPTLSVPVTPTSILDGTLPKDMTFVDTQANDWTIYDPIQTPGLQRQHDFDSITIAPDGKVWIGGKNGIAVFDGKNWASFFLPTNLIPIDSAHLDNIIVDQNKMVWAGGYGYIYHFDGKSWTREMTHISLDNMKINTQDGAFWFTLGWDGAMKFDGTNWTTYTHEDGMIDGHVSDISIDKSGKVWLATGDGISSYDGNEWHNYSRELFCPESSCYLDGRILSIAVDADGSVWVAYHEGGLFHYDSGKWERFENDLIFKDYFPVEHMCFTPDGKLWIGKWSQHDVALFYFEDKQWHIPRISGKKGFDRSAPVAHINGIACANDNSIWYVSASIGVGHYTP